MSPTRSPTSSSPTSSATQPPTIEPCWEIVSDNDGLSGCCRTALGTQGSFTTIDGLVNVDGCRVGCALAPTCYGFEWDAVKGCTHYDSVDAFDHVDTVSDDCGANHACFQCQTAAPPFLIPPPLAANTIAPAVLGQCAPIVPLGCCQTSSNTGGVYTTRAADNVSHCESECLAWDATANQICTGVEFRNGGSCRMYTATAQFHHTTNDSCGECSVCSRPGGPTTAPTAAPTEPPATAPPADDSTAAASAKAPATSSGATIGVGVAVAVAGLVAVAGVWKVARVGSASASTRPPPGLHRHVDGMMSSPPPSSLDGAEALDEVYVHGELAAGRITKITHV
jgi:hypothetical protein